jgi:Lrp/AsnC family transcriptional regulator, regulator for asnA, asnC and gidA
VTQPPSNGRERSSLDEVDLGIIRLLQENGRVSNTDISRALSVSETTVRNRVSRLLENDVITITAVPTPDAFDLHLATIIGLSVQLDQLEAVTQALTKAPETRFIVVATGRYDLITEAYFRDQDHLHEFLTTVVGPIPGVRDVEASVILRIPKRSFLEV